MFALILSMTIWGTLGAFALWAKTTAINIAFYRCLFGAMVAGSFLLKSKEKFILDKNLLVGGIAGIFLVLDWVFLFKSFQAASITIGNVSYCLQPFILVFLAYLLKNEHINIKKAFLMCICLFGVLLTTDIHSIYHHQNILLGMVFALLAGFFYSIFTLLMKSLTQAGFSIMFIQLLIGGFLLLPFASLSIFNFHTTPYLIIIGVVHTTFAYLLYYKALNQVNISYIAVLSYLDPIVAIGTDVVFFKAQLNSVQILGILITLISALTFTKISGAK